VAVDHHQSTQRGFVLIWVGLGMLLFLGLAALVIDAGYLYLTKKQLSVAADSGVLAGATQIVSPTDCTSTSPSPTSNYNARVQAQVFAKSNKAGGGSGTGETKVDLALNTGNDPNGDIVLGNFTRRPTSTSVCDPNDPADPCFIPCQQAGGTPINAMRVHARRTGESGDGIATNNRVSTFFAGVLDSDFKTSGVGARATAEKIVRTSYPVAIPSCVIPPAYCPAGATCSGLSDTVDLKFNNSTAQNACWTAFDSVAGASKISGYIENPKTIPCIGSVLPTTPISLTNGTNTSDLHDLRAACEAHNCTVTPWIVNLPVLNKLPNECAPPEGTGTLNCSASPSPIVGFVTLGITGVEDSGNPKVIHVTFDILGSPPSGLGLELCSVLVE
jgi:hypothetical protein